MLEGYLKIMIPYFGGVSEEKLCQLNKLSTPPLLGRVFLVSYKGSQGNTNDPS